MAQEQIKALPLLGYRILRRKEHPGFAAVVLKTQGGRQGFLVTREMLEHMAKQFAELAAKMPQQENKAAANE